MDKDEIDLLAQPEPSPDDGPTLLEMIALWIVASVITGILFVWAAMEPIA